MDNGSDEHLTVSCTAAKWAPSWSTHRSSDSYRAPLQARDRRTNMSNRNQP